MFPADPVSTPTVQSVEAVTSLQLFSRLVVELSGYLQQVKDRIEFLQAGTNFHPRNQGEQDSLGLELTARLALGRLSMTGYGELFRSMLLGGFNPNPPALYPSFRLATELNLAIPEGHINLNARLGRVGAGARACRAGEPAVHRRCDRDPGMHRHAGCEVAIGDLQLPGRMRSRQSVHDQTHTSRAIDLA